jgi:CheY-like chemotaxis protein
VGAQSSGRRILVVDDDLLVLEVVATMLESVGHEVTSTRYPQNALELIEAEHFDLIITDLGMPLVNGWAVASQAKAVNSSTPVLLLTGWGTQYEKEDLSKHGVDLVLAKPFDWSGLTGAVERLLTASIGKGQESRKHKRYRGRKAEWACSVVSSSRSDATPGWLADISMGGLSFLHHGHKRPEGSMLRLNLLSSAGGEIAVVQGTVVYEIEPEVEVGSGSMTASRRCGIQFEGLSQRQRSQLHDFIREYAMSDD